jgi:S-DNA-T family DNA segregation ATPase FtsK/SpoIIIE
MVNSLICGLLINNTPETLRFIMIDPKRVELTGYNGIPHLMTPVVVEIDRVVGILQWVTHEMDKRYEKFAKLGARHIADYNQRRRDESADILPYLVVVIDELADLMMVAPDQTERLIARMAQLARATGIHLVISTQRPSVDVVTGIIKANFPARIAFAVASGTDSRVILDTPGAERLLGRGDMLFQAPDAPAPVRLQGVYLAESEIIRIVNYWKAFAGSAPQARMSSERDQSEGPSDGVPLKQMPIWDEIGEIQEQEEQDEIFDEAVALVRRRKRASISMLQRRLRIGYTRAARIIEDMESRGIISPPKGGAHHRDVLDYGETMGPADL